jgi:hypothetical protein
MMNICGQWTVGVRLRPSPFRPMLMHLIETYAPSSPMTPTSEQTDPDQIDELFSLSSPNTEPLPIKMLMDSMIGMFCSFYEMPSYFNFVPLPISHVSLILISSFLDDVEIPRTEKLGSGMGSFQPLGNGKWS